MNFYAVAKDAENKQFIISSEKKIRLQAQIEIELEAKQRGLVVNIDEVRKVSGTGKQPSTNTKFFLNRKRNNGDNGVGYDKAL